jgi:hypothetical protein
LTGADLINKSLSSYFQPPLEGYKKLIVIDSIASFSHFTKMDPSVEKVSLGVRKAQLFKQLASRLDFTLIIAG